MKIRVGYRIMEKPSEQPNEPKIPGKNSKPRRRVLGWLAGGAALVGMGIAAGPLLAASPKPDPLPLTAGPRRVQTAEVQAGPTVREQRFSGSLRARQRATLGFTLSGRLASREVEVGQRVKRRQVLARLDARELSNAVKSTRAALDEVSARRKQTERDHARSNKLWVEGVITTQDREQVESQRAVLGANERASRARLNESRRLLSETVLRASFDGVVVAVHRERGELVGPAAPIVEVSGDARLELEVFVPEQSLSRLKPDADVVVDLPIMGKLGLRAVVQRIGTATSGAGRLFPVVVELVDPTPDARPGMTAEVVLPLGAASGLTVPVAAVRGPFGHGTKSDAGGKTAPCARWTCGCASSWVGGLSSKVL